MTTLNPRAAPFIPQNCAATKIQRRWRGNQVRKQDLLFWLWYLRQLDCAATKIQMWVRGKQARNRKQELIFILRMEKIQKCVQEEQEAAARTGSSKKHIFFGPTVQKFEYNEDVTNVIYDRMKENDGPSPTTKAIGDFLVDYFEKPKKRESTTNTLISMKDIDFGQLFKQLTGFIDILKGGKSVGILPTNAKLQPIHLKTLTEAKEQLEVRLMGADGFTAEVRMVPLR
jgi:hypothetical protein